MEWIEALDRVLAEAAALPSEQVKLEEALGRALSVDVTAARTVPPWDNSAMDGYAVRSADGSGEREILEHIAAGQVPTRTLVAGTCSRIMTGAPVPEGCDAVVMQEKTERVGEGRVRILEAPSRGLNVRSRGEDARAGDVLLAKNTPLGIPELALLTAQGFLEAPVARRPRAGILSTGDELRAPGSVEDAGGIIDTNGLALKLAVKRAGGEPVPLGIAKDTVEAVVAALATAPELDVLITSAGVSVGDHDPVKEALAQLGMKTVFWRVAIKPGKPMVFGLLGKTLVFGLPGNPTSTLVTFELFVRPVLRAMLGFSEPRPAQVSGVTAAPYKKAQGLTHFVRVTAALEHGTLTARPLASQTSGVLRSAASATHLMVVHSESDALRANDAVTLLPVSWIA